MTPTAPISYLAAQAACLSAVLAMRKAGPAACGMPPSVYVPVLADMERTAELLGLHAERVAAKNHGEQP